jgi:hypothetical protein
MRWDYYWSIYNTTFTGNILIRVPAADPETGCIYYLKNRVFSVDPRTMTVNSGGLDPYWDGQDDWNDQYDRTGVILGLSLGVRT